MSQTLLHVKGYRRRWIKTGVSVGLIVVGACIAMLSYYRAHIPDLERYMYGDSGDWLTGFRDRQLAPLQLELLFVLGYGLVLIGFACIYRWWATSSFGRAMARYVLVAAIMTVLADWAKDCFLYWRLHSGPACLSTAISAAAAIKWCAGLLALGGVVAVVGLSFRGGTGLLRRYGLPKFPAVRKAAERADMTCADWWNHVWAPTVSPVIDDARTREYVEKNESSWLKAYNVPDANEIIEKRIAEPVQAICLSGGGVRSACVAMGATQVFSQSKPINPTKPDPPDLPGPRQLIDTVDYVISVSGGGFTAGARLLATQPSGGAAAQAPDEVSVAEASKQAPDIEGSTKVPVAQPQSEGLAGQAPDEASADGASKKAPDIQDTTKASPTRSSIKLPLLSQRFEQGSAEFEHFRRHSSYIADSPAELIAALAVVLKNLIASLAILFTVPAVLGWVFGYLSAVSYFSFATFVPLKPEDVKEINPKNCPLPHVPWQASHAASWWAVGVFAILAVGAVMAAILVEWLLANECSERMRLGLLKAARGSAIFAVLVLAVVAGLPGLMHLCSMARLDPEHATKIVSGVVGLNYVAAIVTMVTRKHPISPLVEAVKPSLWKRLLPPAVLQLILVLLTFVLLASAWLVMLGGFALGIFKEVAPHACENGVPHMPGEGLWLLLAVLMLGFADVTSLSLHPFYRSRLARTFAVRRVKIFGRWQAARFRKVEWTWLTKYGKAPHDGPKFIFATAAALSGQATTAPGLDAVSYVLSADYIGGPELGWLNTRQLLAVAPPRIRQDLTVVASIAVSGAAFASAMGRQNKGYQKLLAISGARLGTWLPNPKLVGKLYDAQKRAQEQAHEQAQEQAQEQAGAEPEGINRPQPESLRERIRKLVCGEEGDEPDREDEYGPWPTSLPTIRGAGYFYREVLGINYDDARLVQVTDGGHYENLGLVEALRRRCRLIFCIDAGGDAPPLLSTLSDAMRLAEYELGVTIKFNERGPYSVNDLAPGSGTPFPEGHAFARLNSRITKGTVAFARIKYPLAAGLASPQKPSGVLIFAKALLWKDCPEWLLTYAAQSEVFPHDPTSDQWFNEAQFAAYTALGRILGNHAVDCAASLQRAGMI
jgi:hypothetical protein